MEATSSAGNLALAFMMFFFMSDFVGIPIG
jgi:hypothetical protein